jgi:hypothetical protein
MPGTSLHSAGQGRTRMAGHDGETWSGGHHVDSDFIHDLFAPFGPVTVRRMFSGAGIFAEGLMFGLIVRDVIYLKADDTNLADFEREGSHLDLVIPGRRCRRRARNP